MLLLTLHQPSDRVDVPLPDYHGWWFLQEGNRPGQGVYVLCLI